jgi:hypothetical protein
VAVYGGLAVEVASSPKKLWRGTKRGKMGTSRRSMVDAVTRAPWAERDARSRQWKVGLGLGAALGLGGWGLAAYLATQTESPAPSGTTPVQSTTSAPVTIATSAPVTTGAIIVPVAAHAPEPLLDRARRGLEELRTSGNEKVSMARKSPAGKWVLGNVESAKAAVKGIGNPKKAKFGRRLQYV